MKKVISLIFALLLISAYTFAQRGRGGSTIKWLNIAPKAGIGNSILINQDITDDENIKPDYLSPSYCFGGRTGITFGDHIGVYFELLYSYFGQKYDVKTPSYDVETKINTLDYVGLLRYTSAYGIYVETGLKFSNMKSAKETNTADEQERDMMNNYISKYKNVIFGVGLAPLRRERFEINFGVRASYGLDDITDDYIFNGSAYNRPPYSSDSPTNPLTVRAILEFNYIFGFFGDASCGNGRLMLFQ